MMAIRILLVDDHTLFRQALRSLLERSPAMEVVGEASEGNQVDELVEQVVPDVVVMDVNMPGINGIETTRRLVAKHPQLKVIALSAFVYKRFVLEMQNAGALGYVAKSAAGDELLRAIGDVVKGKQFVSPEIAATLLETRHQGGALGRREKEVLCLLAEGKSSAQIAVMLHIAPSTVEVHRRNIMAKLDLHSVVELTKYAIREGMVTP